MHGMGEDERQEAHAHIQRFGLQKRRPAKIGIFANADVFCAHPAGQDRKPKIAYLHRPPQGLLHLAGDHGPETVYVNQKRQRDNYEDQHTNNRRSNDQGFAFHDDRLATGSLARGFIAQSREESQM